jgi:hypothetical protein
MGNTEQLNGGLDNLGMIDNVKLGVGPVEVLVTGGTVIIGCFVVV